MNNIININSDQAFELGNLGERIIVSHLYQNDWNVYYDPRDKRHPIDFVGYYRKKDLWVLIDIKTKPARIRYADTGFNLNHYKFYKEQAEKHKMRCFLYFVDSDKSQVYGNYLDELEKERIVNGQKYPIIEKYEKNNRITEIIYFPLTAMNKIMNISTETNNQLKMLSQRNTNYKQGVI